MAAVFGGRRWPRRWRPARRPSFISVRLRGAADAIIEAAEAGIAFIVCITEGIRPRTRLSSTTASSRSPGGTRLLGPNCPGIISPGKCNIGITSGDIALAGGAVGIVSRSGTLTYQACTSSPSRASASKFSSASAATPCRAPTSSTAWARSRPTRDQGRHDDRRDRRLPDERAARVHRTSSVTKPVATSIAGVTAPPGRKMGHAGAIISGSQGTAQAKMESRCPPPVSRWRRTRPSAARGGRHRPGAPPPNRQKDDSPRPPQLLGGGRGGGPNRCTAYCTARMRAPPRRYRSR